MRFVNIMWHASIWKFCVSQWRTTFPDSQRVKAIQRARPPVDINVKVHKRFIDKISDCTLQQAFKNYHLLSFGLLSKKEILLSIWRAVKLHFSTTGLGEVRFSSFLWTKATYQKKHWRQKQIREVGSLPLRSQDVKEVSKDVKQCNSCTFHLVLENTVSSLRIGYLCKHVMGLLLFLNELIKTFFKNCPCQFLIS